MLKEWLKENGHTRESFARELGMSVVFVINLVNQKNTDIRVSSLAKIHEVTGLPYEDLVRFCMKA